MRSGVFVAIAIVLAGCSTHTFHVKRYTWTPVAPVTNATGDSTPVVPAAPAGAAGASDTVVATAEPARLREVSGKCLKESNDMYVPNLYGGGKAIKETLYKDCVERHGYVKASVEELTVKGELDHWAADGPRYRVPGVPCRPDQTC